MPVLGVSIRSQGAGVLKPMDQQIKQIVRNYNPISTTPCDPGWLAIFEIVDEKDRVIGLAEEVVVLWAVVELSVDVLNEDGTQTLTSERQPNFVCGLVVDPGTEGGLKPALVCEGLIGYQAPTESFEDFAEKVGFDPTSFEFDENFATTPRTHNDELH